MGAYTRCIHRLLPPLLPQPVAYRRGTGSRESHPRDQHWSQNHSVGAYTRCIHRLLPPLPAVSPRPRRCLFGLTQSVSQAFIVSLLEVP